MDKKVLLVADDVEMNRNVIRRFLKNDFRVLEAEDGEETLNILRSEHVDLLLLDIIMPKKDGLEVLREIKDDSSCEKLGILVATSTKEKTERSALSLGADDIVSKPYDPIVIKKRLENILALQQARPSKPEQMIREERAKNQQKIAESVEMLYKISKVLDASKDNPGMIDVIVKDIREEADKIRTILNDAKE